MESQNIKPILPKDNVIIENKELNIWEALIPVIALVGMLFYNVFFVFGDDALSGSNQFILILGYGWTGQETGSGLSDMPRPALGVFASSDRL